MTKPFADVKNDLAPDGALRDFYVQGTSVTEWDRFLAVAPCFAERTVFEWGEKEYPLPQSFRSIRRMQEQDPTNLTMWVSGQTVCCHFFVESEVELDFRPDDFQTEQKWSSLVAFFQSLVNAIGKRGIITQENCVDYVIDEIMPKETAGGNDVL